MKRKLIADAHPQGDEGDLKQLPCEVWQSILEEKCFSECMVMRQISRYWNKILPTLITVGDFDWKSETLKLNSFPNLRLIQSRKDLKLSDYYRIRLDKVAPQIRLLQFLEPATHFKPIMFSRFTGLVSLRLRSAFKFRSFEAFVNLKALRILSLDDIMEKDYSALGELTWLEVFSFSHSECIFDGQVGSGNCIGTLNNALLRMANLKSLRLFSCYTNYAFLEKMKELRFLDILCTFCVHGAKTETVMLHSISQMKHLKHLAIPRWFSNPTEITKALSGLPSLNCLLTHQPIDINPLRHLRYYRFKVTPKTPVVLTLLEPRTHPLSVTISVKWAPSRLTKQTQFEMAETACLYASKFMHPSVYYTNTFPVEMEEDFFQYCSSVIPSFSYKEFQYIGIDIYYLSIHHDRFSAPIERMLQGLAS